MSTRPGIFLRGRKNIPADIVFPQTVTSSLNKLIAFLILCRMNKGLVTGRFADLVNMVEHKAPSSISQPRPN